MTDAHKPTGNSPAASPIVATTIHTPADGLNAGWHAVGLGDGKRLPVYVASPIGPGPFPVIIVVQEIFGVHEHITDVARRLAKLGYLAAAPELYFRQGDAKSVTDMDALRRDFVAKTPDAQVLADLDATVAWTATQGGDLERVGLTGFCWGGRIAWLYAAYQSSMRPARLKAAVAWYGRLSGDTSTLQPKHPVDVAAAVKIPVLGLYGGQDQGIPLTAVAAMRTALLAAGNATADIVVYPEAGHAFHADYRASYRPAAAADGWNRLVQWFAQHGVR